jgi:hypothetical protein
MEFSAAVIIMRLALKLIPVLLVSILMGLLVCLRHHIAVMAEVVVFITLILLGCHQVLLLPHIFGTLEAAQEKTGGLIWVRDLQIFQLRIVRVGI